MLLLATDGGELFDRCVGVLGMRITVPIAGPRPHLSGTDTRPSECPETEVSSPRAEETATVEDRGSDAAAYHPLQPDRHPYAPDVCPSCEWTNTGLMNYGVAGVSCWLCHGCAARRIQEADRSLACACELCGKPGTSMCKSCRDSCPCPGCVKRRADDSSAPAVSDRAQGVDCPMCEENVPHTHAPTSTRTDVTNPPPMRFADILKSPGFRKMMEAETDRALRDFMASGAALAAGSPYIEGVAAAARAAKAALANLETSAVVQPAHVDMYMTSELAHDIQNARLVLGWNQGESLTDAANRAQQRTAEARQQRDVAIAFADSIEVAKAARDRAELGAAVPGVPTVVQLERDCERLRSANLTATERIAQLEAEVTRLRESPTAVRDRAEIARLNEHVTDLHRAHAVELTRERATSEALWRHLIDIAGTIGAEVGDYTSGELTTEIQSAIHDLRSKLTANVTDIVIGPDKAWEQTAKALRAEVDALTKDLAETAAKLIDARRQALEARTLLTDLREALG